MHHSFQVHHLKNVIVRMESILWTMFFCEILSRPSTWCGLLLCSSMMVRWLSQKSSIHLIWNYFIPKFIQNYSYSPFSHAWMPLRFINWSVQWMKTIGLFDIASQTFILEELTLKFNIGVIFFSRRYEWCSQGTTSYNLMDIRCAWANACRAALYKQT